MNPVSKRRFDGFLITLLASLSAVLLGCSHKVEARPMPTKNPVDFVFSASPEEVRACFLNKIRFLDPGQPDLLHPELFVSLSVRKLLDASVREDNSGFTRHVFDSPANANDVVINSTRNELGLSEVYHAGGCPVPYLASFHVHLVDLEDHKTRAEVRVLESKVIAGTEFAIGHAWRQNVYQDVPPTTIDEYRILQWIGHCLHHENMPPLALPPGLLAAPPPALRESQPVIGNPHAALLP